MTREEAIEILEEVKTMDDSMYQFSHKYMDALEMAIEALQTEPFINKPCVSEQACHEDKMKVLEKIKAEMLDIMIRTYQEVKAIIDKYTAESEDEK